MNHKLFDRILRVIGFLLCVLGVLWIAFAGEVAHGLIDIILGLVAYHLPKTTIYIRS